MMDLSTDPLSKKEEQELIRIAQSDKKEDATKFEKEEATKARHKLVYANMRYAIGYVRRFNKKCMTHEDFNQIAMVGVLDAIDTFDLSHDVRLSTYAAWRIRLHIVKALVANDMIRVPFHSGKEPHVIEQMYDTEDTRKEKEPIEKEELWFMDHLSKTDKIIVEQRYLNSMTLREVSAILKLSRERVRQLSENLFWRIRYAEKYGRDRADKIRLFKKVRRPSRGAEDVRVNYVFSD